MFEWNPDMDAAPRDGTLILAFGPYDEIGVVAWCSNDWIYQADGQNALRTESWAGVEYFTMDAPTHWQPLPQLPEPLG